MHTFTGKKLKMTQVFKEGSAYGVTPVQLDSGVANFEEGMKVKVSGTSKGRGFAGVVKRHGFAGGRRSHGNKHHERAPGSVGAGTGMARVIPGLRMAGRMGMDRVSYKNIQIIGVDAEKNVLMLNGSVPGIPGRKVEIVADVEPVAEEEVKTEETPAEVKVEEIPTKETPIEEEKAEETPAEESQKEKAA